LRKVCHSCCCWWAELCGIIDLVSYAVAIRSPLTLYLL
jgi:hypothetical protein